MMKRNFYPALFGTCMLLAWACNSEPESELPCDYFHTDRVLTDKAGQPIDYSINCMMSVTADLLIEPGVVIEFGPQGGLVIESGGEIEAIGEPNKRILFTGKDKINGGWRGILINTASYNQLHYCDIEYAGNYNTDSENGSIIIQGGAQAELEYIAVRNSGGAGITALQPGADFDLVSSSISAGTGPPVRILPAYMGFMSITTDFTGNAGNYVEVELNTNSITTDMAWDSINVPYRIVSNYSGYTDLTLEADVTVVPGTIIEFESGTGIMIAQNGSLNALTDIASTDDDVVFTGVQKVAGSWKGIYFRFSQNMLNALVGVRIEYAGNINDGGNFGVGMWGSPALSMGYCVFADINGCALADFGNTSMNPNPNFTDLGPNTYINVTSGNTCYP